MKTEQLRKSILKMAIQGKLVQQDPNDEPAAVLLEKILKDKQKLIKEGKIKKDKCDSVIFKGEDNYFYRQLVSPNKLLTDFIEDAYYEISNGEIKDISEEIPFDIPNNWRFTKLENITFTIGNRNNQILSKEILDSGMIPVVSQGKSLIDGYTNDKCKIIEIDEPVIMFGDHTRNVKIIDFPFVIGADGTKFFKPIHVNALFLYYLISYIADSLHNLGYARHFSLLKKEYLPIPPLAEQERIVVEIQKYESLIAEYDKLEKKATALDNNIKDKLKKSVLQYAIQGKLVSQDPNDEPVSVLLERICDEKRSQLGKKHVDSYIYKSDDNCYYEKVGKNKLNLTGQIPFTIPETWSWCRLNTIVTQLTDGTHRMPKYTSEGIHFISVKDISSGEIVLTDTKYISKNEHIELSKRCSPEFGDILLTKVGTTGIPVLINTNIPFSLFVSVALLKFNHNTIFDEFFVYLLKTPLVQKQAEEHTRGVGNKNWVLADIANTLLAIPPLAEQQRIVSKINKIFTMLS